MKIVYFATYYTPYLNSFYADNIGLKNKTYKEQFDTIINDYFGAFCSYHNWTIQLGHESQLIIANCEPLQKKWAEERGVSFSKENWEKEIALEQIKRFKPDVFYIGSMFEYYGQFINEVKKICNNIFGWISCPIPNDIDITQMDLLFSSTPRYIDDFRKKGVNAELLTAGFDPEIINTVKPTKETIPFSFVGGFTPAHSNRIQTVRKMIKKSNMDVWGYGLKTLLYPESSVFFWKNKKKNTNIKNHIKGELWGLEMYQLLKDSKITFNAHINMANGIAVNMRMYEATGMGTLLLTDGSPNSTIFEDGKDVVFYKSTEDAIEKINYYLEHEEERLKIAKSGQQKTLENFSYEIVTTKMIGYFIKYMR